jgi:DNA-binding response OmpR family regulator
LLVDDDQRFSDLLRRGISSKGFKVSVAKSVSEAETIISTLDSGLSLIISDLHMPDKSGVSLLRNVKERGVSVPVIILSSDDSTDAQLEILNMGAHAIVAKSSDPRILFAWIYRLIGTSSNPESQVV